MRINRRSVITLFDAKNLLEILPREDATLEQRKTRREVARTGHPDLQQRTIRSAMTGGSSKTERDTFAPRSISISSQSAEREDRKSLKKTFDANSSVVVNRCYERVFVDHEVKSHSIIAPQRKRRAKLT